MPPLHPPLPSRVTNSDNGITNGVELCESTSGAQQILTSNNDSYVRLFDASSLKQAAKFEFPWAVNFSTSNPADRKVLSRCCPFVSLPSCVCPELFSLSEATPDKLPPRSP